MKSLFLRAIPICISVPINTDLVIYLYHRNCKGLKLQGFSDLVIYANTLYKYINENHVSNK